MRYREDQEVRAPANVPEAGVRAGDRGIVTVELRGSPPAVEVMYDAADGEPGPCVIYSPDLSEVYSRHPGYNTE